MRVGSLFSGIGGFDLGLERAGFTTAWFCEQDEYCQRVLAKHWPTVPCYADVRELRGDAVEAVDVLCGGFPCQDISVAGKGAGLAGARSGLWSEFARLIAELRPRYVLVENVPMLRRRGLEQVLADLLACGYDAEWDGIPASGVGAPHLRDRIWLVAYPAVPGDANGLLADTDWQRGTVGREARYVACAARAPQGHCEQRQRSRHAVDHRGTASPASLADPAVIAPGGSDAATDALAEGGQARQVPVGGSERGRGLGGPGPWAVEPDVGRVAHGVPARVDRLAALGNALVPQIAEWLGHRILEFEASKA